MGPLVLLASNNLSCYEGALDEPVTEYGSSSRSKRKELNPWPLFFTKKGISVRVLTQMN